MIFLPSVLLFSLPLGLFGLNNGLALTPPMGWLAWERFKCVTDCEKYKGNCISEDLFIQMADHLIKDGYKDVGYTYINIDDCWLEKSRSLRGELVADRKRFPRGIKFLADYMHKRGLKLGIYQCFGKITCMGYPGSMDHMEKDARTFAKWDVDMLKLDGCYTHTSLLDEGYRMMGVHLNKTGRPMVYSCSWPYYHLIQNKQPNYEAISKSCNMWRIYHDITDSWKMVESVIDFVGDNQEVLTKFVGPGRWTDPDMLIIGNHHLTYKQARIHMSVWAILPAPLLMSNDLRTVKPEFREILQNKNIININQDPLGLPGKRVYKKEGIEVWTRQIMPSSQNEKSYALLFISRQNENEKFDVTFQLQEFGLNNSWGYNVIDLYDESSYGTITPTQEMTIGLVNIDSVMLKAKALNKSQHQKLRKSF